MNDTFAFEHLALVTEQVRDDIDALAKTMRHPIAPADLRVILRRFSGRLDNALHDAGIDA